MIYGAWLSAAGMAGNLYRQNVAANNMANIDTVGFKHDLALLRERPVESQEDSDAAGYASFFYDLLTGGTVVKPTIHSFEQGPPIPTGQPLDAMIEGEGFFQVLTEDGVRYTRDGRFAINDQGMLVTVAGGRPVLDDGGAPITLAPESGKAKIGTQGRIQQGDVVVAVLGVVEFDDVNKLRKIGSNMFVATDNAEPKPATHSKVLPEMVEGSTIDPVSGLVEMIQTARSFQMNASMLNAQDTTLGRAVTEIAKF